jgi:hypothetical protein
MGFGNALTLMIRDLTSKVTEYDLTPAGGGEGFHAVSLLPVAGYLRWVGSSAALDVLSDKVQNILFYVNLIRPGLTLDHHIRHR